MSETPVRVVLMTTPDADTGRAVARTLVEERLVACGNVLPGVSSVFRWEGETRVEDEALVILKTTAESLDDMLERARSLHPYEVPELICLPVTEGWPPYLDWVSTEVVGGG